MANTFRPSLSARLMAGLTVLVVSASVPPVSAAPEPLHGSTNASTVALVSGTGEVGSLDPNTQVSLDGGGTFQPARVVSPDPLYSTLPGTKWVSDDTAGSARQFSTTVFRTTFQLPAGFKDPSISVQVHADNAAQILLNAVEIGAQPDAETRLNFQDPGETYNAAAPFVAGKNVLEFVVHNFSGPMGLDYKALVTAMPDDVVPPPAFTWEVESHLLHKGEILLDEPAFLTGPNHGGPLGNALSVSLNGCANLGWTSVEFTVDGSQLGTEQVPACSKVFQLREGRHEVKMTVEGGPGAGTTSHIIDVVHHVIVGMGDSLASGEGTEPAGGWVDANCHRSASSPQALAAKALEDHDQHSAVTFIFVACSRARINGGLIAPQLDAPGGMEVSPQVDLVREHIAERELTVDRILLSIGANDIGFEGIVRTCARFDRCPTRFPESNDSLHEEVQNDLAELPGLYEEAAIKLLEGGLVRSRAEIMLTETPTVGTEHDHEGAYTMQSPSGTRYCDEVLLYPLPGFLSGIADEEFAWASQVVQDGDPTKASTFRFQRNLRRDVDLTVRQPGLNTLIRSSPSGFTSVIGAAKMFDGRGYCAPDETRYIVQAEDPSLPDLLGNLTQVMHPNPAGQAAWGKLIGDALIGQLISEQ